MIKRMIKKGRLGLLLAGFAMLAALAMTGCPNGNQGDPDPTPPTPTLPTTPTPDMQTFTWDFTDTDGQRIVGWVNRAGNETGPQQHQNHDTLHVSNMSLFPSHATSGIAWGAVASQGTAVPNASAGRIQVSELRDGEDYFLAIANVQGPASISIVFSGTGGSQAARGPIIFVDGVEVGRFTNEAISDGNRQDWVRGTFDFDEEGEVDIQIGLHGGPIRVYQIVLEAGDLGAVPSAPVLPDVTNVTISAGDEVAMGSGLTLTATVIPEETNSNVIWVVEQGYSGTDGTVTYEVTGNSIALTGESEGQVRVRAISVAVAANGNPFESEWRVVTVIGSLVWPDQPTATLVFFDEIEGVRTPFSSAARDAFGGDSELWENGPVNTNTGNLPPEFNVVIGDVTFIVGGAAELSNNNFQWRDGLLVTGGNNRIPIRIDNSPQPVRVVMVWSNHSDDEAQRARRARVNGVLAEEYTDISTNVTSTWDFTEAVPLNLTIGNGGGGGGIRIHAVRVYHAVD